MLKGKPTVLWIVPGIIHGHHLHAFILLSLDHTVKWALLAGNLERERVKWPRIRSEQRGKTQRPKGKMEEAASLALP